MAKVQIVDLPAQAGAKATASSVAVQPRVVPELLTGPVPERITYAARAIGRSRLLHSIALSVHRDERGVRLSWDEPGVVVLADTLGDALRSFGAALLHAAMNGSNESVLQAVALAHE